MTFENAIAIIESALAPEQLTELQKTILHHVWNGDSYLKMSFNLQYNHGYIKDVGAGLWRLLSDALGEKVKKHNLRTCLARYQHRQSSFSWEDPLSTNQSSAGQRQPLTGLGLNAIQDPLENAQTLSRWIMQEQRPVVAVFDVSRLNKKTVKAMSLNQPTPPVLEGLSSNNILQYMLQSLEPELDSAPLDQPEVLIAQLLEVLSQRQCLLVLAA
ncbi:hypothetical protein C7293_16850 [filamentous cyanobacterium CCT1]|nr:hypothetical protein C7293_16850 [filamentous cyanobacterium CCT1]PSN79970.1 hypothetical protein C8B47_08945 [filamentous cyanobacterium CCP4]